MMKFMKMQFQIIEFFKSFCNFVFLIMPKEEENIIEKIDENILDASSVEK